MKKVRQVDSAIWLEELTDDIYYALCINLPTIQTCEAGWTVKEAGMVK